MQILHIDSLQDDRYHRTHGSDGAWRFSCLLILHLFERSYPKCKFEVLWARSRYYLYSKEELGLHYQADRRKNRQRYLLIPFGKDLCLESSDPLRKLLQQSHNSALCIVYDGYIHYLGPNSLRLHLHSKSDLQ